ncbi:YihY/virulence factor BrkB family protein [Nocardioides sp.]|uniref:YihY/virulence factor BrkB family protein n=1 Tax=Nocardioides sp. TaxID=35761 RepID=UPI00273725F0|nr:YihY/virulence factor BrkB family protein [Nocardioides sp.]MDP3891761.1 YihY/virulence factor BrkB family protein [Nocardioides sp.]
MPSLVDKVKSRVETARARRPLLDHAVRMVQHYGTVRGSLQAGAVTYFAFLSVFPILALSFAVVGMIARVFPDAESGLVEAIGQILPGMVGDGAGQISLDTIRDSAPGIASVGLVAVLYSGLGWLSAMRTALLTVFEKPQDEAPSFVLGKLRDLAAMAVLGLVLLLSVGVSSVVTTLSTEILEALGLDAGLKPLLWILALVVGLAASALLFFTFFKLLGDPDAPSRSLWAGALLGAIGFEALKQLSRFLLASTTEQPAFQAFGIALILVVWINYFSRVVMYAASWAHTSRAARAIRDAAVAEEVARMTPEPVEVVVPRPSDLDERKDTAKVFAAGAASGVALAALIRGRSRR